MVEEAEKSRGDTEGKNVLDAPMAPCLHQPWMHCAQPLNYTSCALSLGLRRMNWSLYNPKKMHAFTCSTCLWCLPMCILDKNKPWKLIMLYHV